MCEIVCARVCVRLRGKKKSDENFGDPKKIAHCVNCSVQQQLFSLRKKRGGTRVYNEMVTFDPP